MDTRKTKEMVEALYAVALYVQHANFTYGVNRKVAKNLAEKALRKASALNYEPTSKEDQPMWRFIPLSADAQRVAEDMAKCGLDGDPGDPLPTLLSTEVEQEIQANIPAFRLAVHLYKGAMLNERARLFAQLNPSKDTTTVTLQSRKSTHEELHKTLNLSEENKDAINAYFAYWEERDYQESYRMTQEQVIEE